MVDSGERHLLSPYKPGVLRHTPRLVNERGLDELVKSHLILLSLFSNDGNEWLNSAEGRSTDGKAGDPH